MKKILYFILLALIFSGCDDFLNYDPLTDKTSANFPGTSEEVLQMMAGIYTTMTNEHQLTDMSYLFVCEVASDEKLGGGGVNDVKAQAYEAFMYSDPDMLNHNWETTYEGIHRAN
ncbi:MAG: RagB/SusD family nutrient uptake outer membrane protein, partial [Bacteroidia bacterium]|nr:RagB/SusD family nutrient uptake outer membrane protein [Bacteroidia bacterium]